LTNTTSGGVWTSSNTSVATVNSISGAVTGVTAGSATITYTYTNANGCTSSVTTAVTINGLPVVASITGTTGVCVGSTTTLASTTAGGVWTSSNAAIATVNTTGIVSGIDAGNATITYTVTNVNGCSSSVTSVVTVNPQPAVQSITGVTAICAGSTTTLASATTGGVWSSSNAAVASVSVTGLVTGLTAGTTTISYTVTNASGCVTAVSATVTINALPVQPVISAGGPTLICPGSTVTLSVPAIYSSYQWSNGLSGTSSITVSQAGNYFVTVTNASGCSVQSAPLAVTIGDVTPPTIVAPANLTVDLTNGCTISGVNLGLPVTADNCSVAVVSNNAPFTFGIGVTEVIWTVYDDFGNAASATQLVTVVDNVDPQITAPANVTVAANLACDATGVFIGDAIGTDNCGFVVTNDAPAVFPLGVTLVTWTITDNSGNTATATQTVTVLDTEAPFVNVKDVTLALDLNGEVVLDFNMIDINSADNCGVDTIYFDQSLFTCSDLGINQVQVTIVDNSGNVSVEQFYVTIEGSGIDEDFDGLDDACDDFIDTNAIVIPSGFSPNGDNMNDNFEILGLESYTSKVLQVYNRYGVLVYESSNYDNSWNGTLLNSGDPLPDATYYYVLELDKAKVESGYVYINRIR
jgi:gliding motility-associated-like protein